MADTSRLQGERVFCHQCSHEWDRAQGGLQCPNCESEFTELETPPSPPPEARSPPPIPLNHPFHNHYPWQDDIPDPEEDDITTYQWNSRGGNGTFSFTTRTFVSGGPGMNRRNVNDDPAMQDLIQNFEGLLTCIIGPQNGRNGPLLGNGLFPFMGGPPPGFPRPMQGGYGGFMSFDEEGRMRPVRGNIPENGNMQDILQALFGATNGPGQGGARGGNGVPDLGAIIAALMAPGHGRAGDAVYTQEAFDQVLTQLMEQTQGSTAPPPASDEAISALPKRTVTADMMGNDGKVECSICMDDCPIGTEVTALPCDHWFHDECIEKWLKTSDTCPHCRKPISDHSEDPQTRPLRPGQLRGSRSSAGGRRPSSVSSPRAPAPRDGSRGNPFTLPDSPSALREARQDFYARRDGSSHDQDRSRSHRSSSTHGTPRPSDSRQANSSSNAGGGPMGWVRNHMPFGS